MPILLLTVSVAQAADPGDEGEGGGATASAADMPQICKDQAAKRNLTGAEADEYFKKCAAAPAGDAERSAAPDERQEGQL